MLRIAAVASLWSFLVVASCRSTPDVAVERLEGAADVSTFSLQSLQGTRDGERLEVRARYGDETRSVSVHLHFNVTPPARLTAGTWTGLDAQGAVRERSLTFLGGQSGPPSVGGRFDLLGSDGRPMYRISLPLQELKRPL